jgi:hypothetical protein
MLGYNITDQIFAFLTKKSSNTKPLRYHEEHKESPGKFFSIFVNFVPD